MNRLRMKVLSSLLALIAVGNLSAQFQKIFGVNYADVVIEDDFWSPKISDVATEALGVCIYQTEEATPRIKNFENVAAHPDAAHQGIYYDDSDVYKALEAMAYALHSVPDKKLETKADDWIDKIAAAQQADGYINTFYTLEGLENRWTDMERHEAYCAGHLIEAGIAYYQATGKRKLLEVGIRMADHMDKTLKQAGKPWVAGHQEIELALVKLYRVTGQEKYLELSEWFLDQRGHGHGVGGIWDRWKDPGYCQDALPVKEQTEISGHAVRAMYMYTGIADLATITEDAEYLRTMLTVWEDVVHRNTYVTGGIGSAGRNEGFSIDYDLPNEEAYCETCASVGMVFWNQRMNWLTGDAKYIDVLERSLYNSALDGISLNGKQFFYPNPLESSGQHSRRDWFGTACCPSNISRLIASLGNYIYGIGKSAMWVNLFVSSKTTQSIAGTSVDLNITTTYPWDNKITLSVNPQQRADFKIHLRIPGWSRNEVIPGNLYHYKKQDVHLPTIKINNKSIEFKTENGYAILNRTWSQNDVIELSLPMAPRLVVSRSEVVENNHRNAIQYGPLIYCIEGSDNAGQVKDVILPHDVSFELLKSSILDEQVIVLQADLPKYVPDEQGTNIQKTKRKITAIPYYTWANRTNNEMRVWIPSKVEKIVIE